MCVGIKKGVTLKAVFTAKGVTPVFLDEEGIFRLLFLYVCSQFIQHQQR
jgi:hypothetical protein